MERKIKAYEKFIAKEAAKKMTAIEKAKLYELHRDTVENFQHERLIHLIITLFFSIVTIISIGIVAWSIAFVGFRYELVPLYLLTTILVILSACYVRHYYFLENHIQKLYKYFEELMK